jgi:hypothetical protein
MTLCEKCIHGDICVIQCGYDEGDERALTYCSEFKSKDDVVEVVRCKDCIHNADNGGDCDRVLIHTHRNLITETNEYQYFKLNYCEYGTPKERGEEE